MKFLFEIALALLTAFGAVIWYSAGLVLKILGWVAGYYGRRPLRALVDVSFLIALGTVAKTGIEIYERGLEGQVELALVETVNESSSFKREFARPGANGGRNLHTAGAPEWLRHAGIRAIVAESRASGLGNMETAVLLAIADRESGFNPLARAQGTSACGLFQFVERTGRAYGLRPEKCTDPRENARAGIRHFRDALRAISRDLAGLESSERLVPMFRLSYCRHHDGLSSESCSRKADETVSRGLPLLFAAHKSLVWAERARAAESDGFYVATAATLERGASRVRDITAPVVARLARFVEE